MFAQKNVCKEADLIIAIAKCVKEDICKYYNVPPKKIVVNYHGLPGNFSSNVKTSYLRMPRFLHIATEHQRKGTKYLLHAMHILQKKYALKCDVVIVGKKDPYYMNLAKRLTVSADFVGIVSEDELKKLYASCTCLVVPSIREGFCLPVIEAASFGKPSIVTRTGALPELVEDGVNGFVVPVGDVNSLAEKMYVLAINDRLRTRMSIEAVKKAEKFRIDITAKRLIDAINSVLK
jgi:glycosyltransferase involved in cell wall biosynthesis